MTRPRYVQLTPAVRTWWEAWRVRPQARPAPPPSIARAAVWRAAALRQQMHALLPAPPTPCFPATLAHGHGDMFSQEKLKAFAAQARSNAARLQSQAAAQLTAAQQQVQQVARRTTSAPPGA